MQVEISKWKYVFYFMKHIRPPRSKSGVFQNSGKSDERNPAAHLPLPGFWRMLPYYYLDDHLGVSSICLGGNTTAR